MLQSAPRYARQEARRVTCNKGKGARRLSAQLQMKRCAASAVSGHKNGHEQERAPLRCPARCGVQLVAAGGRRKLCAAQRRQWGRQERA